MEFAVQPHAEPLIARGRLAMILLSDPVHHSVAREAALSTCMTPAGHGGITAVFTDLSVEDWKSPFSGGGGHAFGWSCPVAGMSQPADAEADPVAKLAWTPFSSLSDGC
eukprot:scaffold7099_cov281-Pinguiococcus_pyrenoidosus.AAC.38